MQFRDLRKQYDVIKDKVDRNIGDVIENANFIGGTQVKELERKLGEFVGVKHCITCANGTDALQLALMAWNIGKGDAVFVPDFTFFSSGEVVSCVGATPIFVDVEKETFNISIKSLETMIEKIKNNSKLIPKVIIAVDLFGQPANFPEIKKIAKKYNMMVLEDGAQGFGGKIGEERACSFGDIATTSFFPAKPLGCYGDGGAIFTNNDEWADLINSYKVHGKGSSKYDNIRIGMNSRLDTMQAAILLAKFDQFADYELDTEQSVANYYTGKLKGSVDTPFVMEGFYSSWAQYTIRLKDKMTRDGLQNYLKENDIPSMIYYQKPMHLQEAFDKEMYIGEDYPNTIKLCDTVLSLPFHPYLERKDEDKIISLILKYLKNGDKYERVLHS